MPGIQGRRLMQDVYSLTDSFSPTSKKMVVNYSISHPKYLKKRGFALKEIVESQSI